MNKGNTTKRCACRDPETGKEIGKDCPKLRRNGRGDSWNPNHGFWQYQIELPPSAAKKRRPLRRGGFSSQTDAEAVLIAIRDALAIPDPADTATLTKIGDLIETAANAGSRIPTVAQIRYQLRLEHDADAIPLTDAYLDRWLEDRKNIAKSTTRSYEAHVRLYFKPVIGSVRVDQLRKSHIQEIFDAIEERNDLIAELRSSTDPAKRDKVRRLRTVGPSTMQRIRATIRKALNDAIRDGYATENPARWVELPPARKPKPVVWTSERIKHWQRTGKIPSRVMVWTPQQTGHFLDHADAANDRLYPMFHLIAFTGLRRGEACGLHWTDIDLDTKTITVRWQILQLGWATEMDDPKTDDSEATVSLDAGTVEVLRAHRIRQWRERAAAGADWIETGLVFTTENGDQYHPANVTKHFKFLGRQAGLPPIRLHDLRHGTAALGRAAGLETKIISGRLRHSSTVITDDLYGSILPQTAHDAAERTAAMVPRRAKGATATEPAQPTHRRSRSPESPQRKQRILVRRMLVAQS